MYDLISSSLSKLTRTCTVALCVLELRFLGLQLLKRRAGCIVLDTSKDCEIVDGISPEN